MFGARNGTLTVDRERGTLPSVLKSGSERGIHLAAEVQNGATYGDCGILNLLDRTVACIETKSTEWGEYHKGLLIVYPKTTTNNTTELLLVLLLQH